MSNVYDLFTKRKLITVDPVQETSKDYFDSHTNLMNVVSDPLSNVGLRKPELIECRSRDGFIPYSHNCGGYESIGFVDLYALFVTGYRSNSDKANEAIDKGITYNLEIARDNLKDRYTDELKGIPDDKVNYHDLYELNLGKLAEHLSELEIDNISEDAVMLSVRFLYHGNNHATVDACINWESPYFRDGKGMSDYMEVEINWTSDSDLEAKLTEAIEKVTTIFGDLVKETY